MRFSVGVKSREGLVDPVCCIAGGSNSLHGLSRVCATPRRGVWINAQYAKNDVWKALELAGWIRDDITASGFIVPEAQVHSMLLMWLGRTVMARHLRSAAATR